MRQSITRRRDIGVDNSNDFARAMSSAFEPCASAGHAGNVVTAMVIIQLLFILCSLVTAITRIVNGFQRNSTASMASLLHQEADWSWVTAHPKVILPRGDSPLSAGDPLPDSVDPVPERQLSPLVKVDLSVDRLALPHVSDGRLSGGRM